MTIVVTDSGIGGYSVAAELFTRLQASPPRDVRIIFFNALFDAHSGYNRLNTLAEKAEKFDAALREMLTFAPDLIAIACNTLSVIYPRTIFARQPAAPVMGIVEIGVNCLLRRIERASKPRVILFATPTTIQQAEHARLLRQARPDVPIIAQACPELIKAIEEGNSTEIDARVNEYVAQAAAQLPAGAATLFASLNCTHFGYAADDFRRAFSAQGLDAEIVNPNSAMTDALFAEITQKQPLPLPPSPKLGEGLGVRSPVLEVVSNVPLHPDGIAALIPLLKEHYAPEAAAALQQKIQM